MKTIDKQFILRFKQTTEERWRNKELNPMIYGYQFQKGTCWNPGLSEKEIDRYEKDIGIAFPNELRILLGFINGTDRPTVNIYGNDGSPHQTSVGVYTYPRDLELVKSRIEVLNENWKNIRTLLSEVALTHAGGDLFPFFIHRFVVCGAGYPGCPVISVHGRDAILYCESLRDYLEKEFLHDG
jgi:hypothetical protein